MTFSLHASMSDLFACRECRAIYVITRLPQSPNAPSSCEVCGSKFPACELGEWLTYQRVETEWTVNEWLTGAPEVQENVVQPTAYQVTDIRQSRKSRTNRKDRDQGFELPSNRLRKTCRQASELSTLAQRFASLALSRSVTNSAAYRLTLGAVGSFFTLSEIILVSCITC